MQRNVRKLLRLDQLLLGPFSLADVGNHATDEQSTVRRRLRPHAVEHPAGPAVVADQPVLDLERLASLEHRYRFVVRLPILLMHRRVIRLLR